VQSVRDLISRVFTKSPFIIDEGLLNEQGILFIGGPPKSYKSFAMNTLAYHLVTGTNLFGATHKKARHEYPRFNVQKPYRVLLLEQEIGDYSLKDRLKPIADSLPEPQRANFYDNLYTHSCDRTLRLDEKLGCERIRDLCLAAKAEVLCLDPFVEFHHTDENSTQEMLKTLRGVDFLRDSLKIAVVISHHAGKSLALGGADSLRGSSAIFGKGDSYVMLSVHNREAGFIRVNPTIRRGVPIRDFLIRLDWTTLTFRFHAWATAKVMSTTLMEAPPISEEEQ
jgi:RecA-family ATPase